MKTIFTSFLNHHDSGCIVLGVSMGLFIGLLLAITSSEIALLIPGIFSGIVFGLITGAAKRDFVRKESERTLANHDS